MFAGLSGCGEKSLLAQKQAAASVNPGLAMPRVCSNG